MRTNKEKRRKLKRRRMNNKPFYRVFSSKLLKSKQMKLVRSITKQHFVPTLNLEFVKRANDASTPTI